MLDDTEEEDKVDCTECRYFRVMNDGTKKCRNKKASGLRKGKCIYFVRRWPIGIEIPDFKESL